MQLTLTLTFAGVADDQPGPGRRRPRAAASAWTDSVSRVRPVGIRICALCMAACMAAAVLRRRFGCSSAGCRSTNRYPGARSTVQTAVVGRPPAGLACRSVQCASVGVAAVVQRRNAAGNPLFPFSIFIAPAVWRIENGRGVAVFGSSRSRKVGRAGA